MLQLNDFRVTVFFVEYSPRLESAFVYLSRGGALTVHRTTSYRDLVQVAEAEVFCKRTLKPAGIVVFDGPTNQRVELDQFVRGPGLVLVEVVAQRWTSPKLAPLSGASLCLEARPEPTTLTLATSSHRFRDKLARLAPHVLRLMSDREYATPELCQLLDGPHQLFMNLQEYSDAFRITKEDMERRLQALGE